MQRVFEDEARVLETHLKDQGLNRSSRRDLVVLSFLSSNKHLSVDDLYALVRRKSPGIGRTTVYRTLKLLESAGLAQALVLSGETRFERVLNRRHHDHFICNGCGAIFEFSSDEIEALQDEEARRIGFRIDGHKHQVFGKCAKCLEAEGGPVTLRLTRIELRHLRMPLKFRFETSFGAVTEKSFLLVQVFTADGAWGLGECVAEDHPYYLPETNQTVAHVIKDFLAPLVLGRDFEDPSEADALFSRIRGHEMAKAALEMAIWDLFARSRNEPLSRTLGGEARETIPAGVSIGLQGSVDALMERVRIEVAAGYQRIKIKIKPGADIDLARAVRKEFPSVPLMVDANSAYTIEDAGTLERFDEFNLMMIEQPLAWNDIVEHSKLQPLLKTPICLDESITSPAAAESAISAGACGIINIKAGRVGGLLNSKRIQALCASKGIPVWCGGMLESGIGRLANIHLQTLPGFNLPGDTSASERYFEEDLIEPAVRVDSRGRIRVPDQPGLGHEVVWSRVERATVHRDAWRV